MRKRTLGLFLGIIMILGLSACGGSKKIDMEKAYNISVLGAEGYGSLAISKDYEYGYNYSLTASGINPKDTKNLFEKTLKKADEIEKAENFYDSIDYKIEGDNKNLKNGDKVEITFTYDENLAKEGKFGLSTKKIKYKVEGLKEAEKRNPFKNVDVEFSGSDGNGYANIRNNSENSSSIYNISKTEGLSNGDKVVLKVDYDPADTSAEGYIYEPTEKTYEVKGLKELKTIDKETLEKGFELEYTGAIPDLEVTVINKLPSKYKELISYEIIDKDLRNGGKVDVRASADSYRLEEAGYKMDSEDEVFSVEIKEGQVPNYINDLSKLDKDTKNKLLKQVNDLALARISGDPSEEIDGVYYLSDLKIKGIDTVYLLSAKEGMEPNGRGWFGSEKIYNQMTFLVHLSGKSGELSDKMVNDNDLYAVVFIDNVMQKADGSFTFDLNKTRSHDYIIRKDKAIQDFVNANASNYNISKQTYSEFMPAQEKPVQEKPAQEKPAQENTEQTKPAQ